MVLKTSHPPDDNKTCVIFLWQCGKSPFFLLLGVRKSKNGSRLGTISPNYTAILVQILKIINSTPVYSYRSNKLFDFTNMDVNSHIHSQKHGAL